MRIGISTSVIQRGKTGVAQYVFALLRAFKAYTAEHQWILYVLEEDVPMFDFIRGSMELVVVPERYRSPVDNIIWHQTRLPGLARTHRLDVLHVPSYRRLLWPKPCALVGTIHDLAPFHVSGKYDWKRMFYGRVVACRLAHRQGRIIAISQNTANDITRFFRVPERKISVVYNGIDHDRFCPGSRAQARAAVVQLFRLEQPYFLYVARLEHPAKNHLRLISAFEKFKTESGSNWQLVLGGSDWHGAETIHAAIRRSNFSSDIRTLGFVKDESLPDLYRAAELFVYPSLYEGFGLPPIEAMACDCPVLTSTRGSLGEVVGSAAEHLDPEDEQGMARKLLHLVGNQQERNRLSAAGLIQARKFDWRRTADATLNVYKHATLPRPSDRRVG